MSQRNTQRYIRLLLEKTTGFARATVRAWMAGESIKPAMAAELETAAREAAEEMKKLSQASSEL